MPREFNLIQRGDLQQRLARGLDLVGESSPARTLDPTVQAVVLLEDLTKQSIAVQPWELRLGGGNIQPAVAAEFAVVALVAPATSNTLLLVEAFSCSPGSTTRFSWGYGSIAGLAPVANAAAFYDFRNGVPAAAGVAQIWSGSDPASLITNRLGRLPSGTSTSPGEVETKGLVLLPGIPLVVEVELVNIESSVYFRWVEVPMGPS